MAPARAVKSLAQALSRLGPFGARTWWGRRTSIVNLTILGVLLLFIIWKSL
jgi:hypothetical protein